MVQYLVNKGETPAVAQGIVNRIHVESGGDPGAVGDNGQSYGLAQWKDSRAVGLLKYGQANNRSPYDWRTQLDYARYEMDTSERPTRERLKQATTPAEAEAIFTSSFERPRASAGELRQNTRGDFNPSTQQFVDGLLDAYKQISARYDAQIRAAQEPRDLERALVGKYLAESQQPPQNMHQAWSQFGGLATALALFGGAFGRRHMNAALNAAAGMLEGANQADSYAYDRAYNQWKDHLALGLKAIEMMNREANEIIERAGHNYDHASANLQTLATLYSLPDLGLDAPVAVVGLVDAGDALHDRAIVELSDRHRTVLGSIVDVKAGAGLHLGLGGAVPAVYKASLINLGDSHNGALVVRAAPRKRRRVPNGLRTRRG
jgi:hypothetical protein